MALCCFYINCLNNYREYLKKNEYLHTKFVLFTVEMSISMSQMTKWKTGKVHPAHVNIDGTKEKARQNIEHKKRTGLNHSERRMSNAINT